MDPGVPSETNDEVMSREMKLHVSNSLQMSSMMTQFQIELRKKEKLLEEQ